MEHGSTAVRRLKGIENGLVEDLILAASTAAVIGGIVWLVGVAIKIRPTEKADADRCDTRHKT